VLSLVKVRAKRKGSRVKKLDRGARDAVSNAAAWRLILNQQRLGNIREYLEGGFWHQDSDARNKLIDRAIDAERKAYTRASAASGGTPAGESIDFAAFENIAPFVEERLSKNSWRPDLSYRDEPSLMVEQEKHLEDEAAESDARAQIETQENELLRLARNAYGETLEIRHRRALFLICNDPSASNSTIAAQVGVRSVKGIKPETVSRIRDKLTELADGILTRSPDDLFREELERLADLAKAQAEVRRAESRLRRAQYWATKSAAELAAFRAFAAPLCEELNISIDDLMAASITPKVDQ
jgi:hypothetical protein